MLNWPSGDTGFFHVPPHPTWLASIVAHKHSPEVWDLRGRCQVECQYQGPVILLLVCQQLRYPQSHSGWGSSRILQHPQRWAKTGTRGILHQPSLQYVHGGQRSSFGGTSVEVVHELLPENSCLHWQSSTSCTTWIWPNHKRSVSP